MPKPSKAAMERAYDVLCSELVAPRLFAMLAAHGIRHESEEDADLQG